MSMNDGDNLLLGLDGDWDSKVGLRTVVAKIRGVITRNDPLSTPGLVVLELTIPPQIGWVAQW